MNNGALFKLGENEPELYRDLLGVFVDSTPSSILLINRDLRIIFANRNFMAKSRKNESEVIGQRLKQVLPEAIIEHMDITSTVRQVFSDHQTLRGERMTYRAPGIPIRIYYYSVLPFVRHGEVENVILVMDDVTEQVRLSEEVRRVERHLASIVESARDIVLSTDSLGHILTWNTAAERLTGYSSWEARGGLFFDRCAPETNEQLTSVFRTLMIADGSQTGEWHLVTKSGSIIPMSWVLSPMKDESGKTVGVVAVGRDLTEHRKLEMQLLQSQKLAALGVMAGGIAHEIRNPLAVCSSSGQFLQNPDIHPDLRRECIEKLLSGIHKASSIIENLLRFARPSSSMEMMEVELPAVLHDSVQLVSNQAKIGKISVFMNFPDGNIVVFGNPNLLQQMFLNLFLNAFYSMPDGGRLSISVEIAGNLAHVHIEDTGCGISQENLEKIFDPFFTLSPVGKGTGLGLSICYSIAKQHLGNIEVQSKVGEGSIFTVILPIL